MMHTFLKNFYCKINFRKILKNIMIENNMIKNIMKNIIII